MHMSTITELYYFGKLTAIFVLGKDKSNIMAIYELVEIRLQMMFA